MLAVGHQHKVAPGDGDVGRHPRPLGADRGLDHLNQNLHAGAENRGDIGDGQLLLAALRLGPDLRTGAGLLPLLAAGLNRLLADLLLGLLVAFSAPFEHFAASRQHLVIVEEGVLFGADVDKRRLQGGFEVDDFPEIDIAHLGLMIVTFNLILFEAAVVEQGEAPLQLLAVQNDLFAFLFHNSLPFKNCFQNRTGGRRPRRKGAVRAG